MSVTFIFIIKRLVLMWCNFFFICRQICYYHHHYNHYIADALFVWLFVHYVLLLLYTKRKPSSI